MNVDNRVSVLIEGIWTNSKTRISQTILRLLCEMAMACGVLSMCIVVGLTTILNV